MNPRSVGWNCKYSDGLGKSWSEACRTVADRANAWSVDCGVAQLNFRGQTCPEEAFDYKWNIEKAFTWKFKPSGEFYAWVQYTNKNYLRFL